MKTRGRFDPCSLLSYAVPAGAVVNFLPEGLRLPTLGDSAFLSLVISRIIQGLNFVRSDNDIFTNSLSVYFVYMSTLFAWILSLTYYQTLVTITDEHLDHRSRR